MPWLTRCLRSSHRSVVAATATTLLLVVVIGLAAPTTVWTLSLALGPPSTASSEHGSTTDPAAAAAPTGDVTQAAHSYDDSRVLARRDAPVVFSGPFHDAPATEAAGGGGGTTVYRGTSIGSELQIHAETGQVMSDAARVGYVESGGSVQAARAASETAHAAGVESWGSEANYVQAHGEFSSELSQVGPRSMISVTTDPAVAKIFAGPEGRVFSATIDPSELIAQTLEGAGESEFLIRHMFGAR